MLCVKSTMLSTPSDIFGLKARRYSSMSACRNAMYNLCIGCMNSLQFLLSVAILTGLCDDSVLADSKGLEFISSPFNEAPGGSTSITAAKNETKASSMHKPEANDFVGSWSRIRSGQFERAELAIRTLKENTLSFKITAMSGANTGEVEGIAEVIGTHAVAHLVDDASDCKIVFGMVEHAIEVEDSFGCNVYGGLNVFFDGIYDKAGTKESQQLLSDVGVIGEKDEAAFKNVVGRTYDQFVNSMQLVYDGEDLDGFGAIVKSGGVRGMFSLREAIVMQGPGNQFWAAVISATSADATEISYFTNVETSRHVLPKTIQKWKDHLTNPTFKFSSK